MKPLLSILIPTVPERNSQCLALVEKLQAQQGAEYCEFLYFGDNRKRSIGHKRNALLQSARGKYAAFCDDDDTVADHYIPTLVGIADRESVDVISFRQSAIWDGHKSTVIFSIHNQDGPFIPDGETLRFPWHVCAWRTDLAQQGVFLNVNWGEDAAWVAQMKTLARNEAHVKDILHFYEHNEKSLAK